MTKPSRIFAILHKALCFCCKAADIPEVEAVIRLLTPQMEGLWAAVTDEAVRNMEAALRVGNQTLSPERRSKFVDDLLVVLASLYAVRTTTDIPRALLRAIEDGSITLLARGAQASSLRLDVLSLGERVAAREDLLTLARGRLQEHQDEIRQVLEDFLASAVLGSLRGPVPSAADGGVPAVLEAWRERLTAALGGADRRWLRSVVDLWAYRWWNLGAYFAGRQAGVLAWEAVAVRDRRTTSFCRWVDRRIVAVEKIERQVRRIVAAAQARDAAAAKAAWPLLAEPEQGTEKVWEAHFARADVGLPPYHWRCRTRIRPLRVE